MKIFRKTMAPTNVDLTPTADEMAVVAQVSRRGTITFGAPTRCPHCETYGFVDRIDLHGGVTDNRCPSCSHVWQVTQRAITLSQSIEVDPANAPIGDGILVRDLARAS
jgi:predicted Zn finger-like uncharacterized protein